MAPSLHAQKLTNESPELPVRFQSVRRVGAGSMGVVHEAIDQDSGQRIAVKALKSAEPDAIRRLKREFRVLAGLVHPNLIHLNELHQDDHGAWITMELVRGPDALTWVELAGEGRIEGALGLAKQLVTALRFLHRRDRLHLDVKPENMVVEGDERLVLLDFGISRAIAATLMEAPTPLRWGGTPAYCAPEQLQSGTVDASADWYGFGSTLYEMLTGTLPYDGRTPVFLAAKERGDPAVPIRNRSPLVETPLAELIDALLSPDPAQRPSGEVVAEFFGVEPESQTGAYSTPAPAFDLVGRDEELARLDACAEEARATGYAEIELRGESGIGKTALVRAFLGRQRRQTRQTVVLAGTCYEREWIPFNAFDSLVTSLVDAVRMFPASMRRSLVPPNPQMLTRLFPGFRRVPEIGRIVGQMPEIEDPTVLLRKDGFASLCHLLEGYADERLLVLALDDVQWGDRDSRALLDHLRENPLSCPVLLLMSRRVAPDEALRPTERETLTLGPLRRDAARALAEAAMGRVPEPEVLDALLAEADGVPLWIEQLGLRWASTGERPSLDGLIERAVDALEPAATAAIEALATSGRPMSLSQLQTFIGESDSLKVVDELGVSGLAVPIAERDDAFYDVRHSRVRDIVGANLPPARKREVSLALADLYITRGGDEDEIARHLLAAGERERGAHYAVLAAREAASALAFGRAARLLEIAVENTDGAERVDLLAELGDLLTNDARAEASARAYLAAAVETDDVARRLQLRHKGAEQLMRSGRVEQGRALLEDLLAESGLTLPSGEVQATLQLLWSRLRLKLRGMEFQLVEESALDRTRLTRIDAAWSAGVTLGLVDAVTAAAFQSRGLLEALELGEPERIGRALGAEAVFRAVFGDHDASAELWERNREIVERHPSPMGRSGLATSESVRAYQRGDWETSYRAGGECLAHLRGQRLNLSWIRSTAIIYRLAAAGHLGKLTELGEELPRELDHARARGDLHAVMHLTLGMPIPVAAILDQAEEGAAEAEAVWQASVGKDHAQVQIHYLRTKTELALYRGRSAEAVEAAQTSWGLVRGSSAARLPVIRNWASELLVRALLADADGAPDGKARRTLKKHIKQLVGASDPWAVAVGELGASQLAWLDGDRDVARATLIRAEAGLGAAGMRLYEEAAVAGLDIVDKKVRSTPSRRDIWEEWDSWGMRPARLIQMVAPVWGRDLDETC